MVLPGIDGIPPVTTRSGFPSVWVSIAVMIFVKFKISPWLNYEGTQDVSNMIFEVRWLCLKI
jgi:hypothetical protein